MCLHLVNMAISVPQFACALANFSVHDDVILLGSQAQTATFLSSAKFTELTTVATQKCLNLFILQEDREEIILNEALRPISYEQFVELALKNTHSVSWY